MTKIIASAAIASMLPHRWHAIQALTAGRRVALPPDKSGEIMPSKISVDRTEGDPPVPEPDAHGQAALILTESLLHVLVEKTILTSAEAIDVIETACQVKHEVAVAAGESSGRMQASLDLLTEIVRSFRAELIRANL